MCVLTLSSILQKKQKKKFKVEFKCHHSQLNFIDFELKLLMNLYVWNIFYIHCNKLITIGIFQFVLS